MSPILWICISLCFLSFKDANRVSCSKKLVCDHGTRVKGKCQCQKDYWGPLCSKYHSCIHGNVTKQGLCNCDNGYFGFNCEAKCKCNMSNAQSCRRGNCLCKKDFSGDRCDHKCNCVNNGHCENKICNCPITHFGDTCSGKCQCFDNHGLCNRNGTCETCFNGYYGTNCESECKCNMKGILDSGCDRKTGACTCISNHFGKTCERCNCHNNEESCDSHTGVCKCKPDYGGTQCEQTRESWCGCDKNNSLYMICDRQTMQCPCRHGFWGVKCQEKCNCGEKSIFQQCDVTNGQCNCKLGYEGNKCNRKTKTSKAKLQVRHAKLRSPQNQNDKPQIRKGAGINDFYESKVAQQIPITVVSKDLKNMSILVAQIRPNKSCLSISSSDFKSLVKHEKGVLCLEVDVLKKSYVSSTLPIHHFGVMYMIVSNGKPLLELKVGKTFFQISRQSDFKSFPVKVQ